MPEHGVWSELAVSEARRQRSNADFVPVWLRADLATRLEALCAELPALPLEELRLPGAPGREGKHVQQEDSLVAHALRVSIGRRRTWVDLGCGRGALSEQLQAATQCRDSHILVDRNPMKRARCRDSAMRARACEGTVMRLVADVADFDVMEHTTGDVTFVSKHLCGCATDLALRRTVPHPLFLAPCCHHLCTWDTYVGREFLHELGVSRAQFEVLCSLAPWASIDVSAPGPGASVGREDSSAPISIDISTFVPATCIGASCSMPSEGLGKLPVASNESWRLPPLAALARCWQHPAVHAAWGDSPWEKRTLGRRSKFLLDTGRMYALMQLYHEVRLVRYTTRSAEDRLLIARGPVTCHEAS